MVIAGAYSLWVFNRAALGKIKLVVLYLTLRECICFFACYLRYN